MDARFVPMGPDEEEATLAP